jgi:oligoribonuclease NrnB/cAMP/cGMP phosphodiesterase (DHH superfamily)
MAKPLCIYHGNCFDGFTAAWAVWKRFGDAWDYTPANYGEPPPDVTGRDVVIVDFSYKRPVLMEMASVARTIYVLDHHKTAQEDLAGLLPATSYNPTELLDMAQFDATYPIRANFDMDRSGAGMAWDFFHPGEARPRFLSHAEDRDLWRFAMEGTREVHAAMSAHPFTFEAWEEIYRAPVAALILEGAAIDRKHLRDINTLLPITKSRITIMGHDVPIANMPITMCSDAGNIMAKGEPFAVTYFDGPTYRNYSLRSTDAGLDVSAIAKAYGGGGHRNAAGFKLEHGVNP